MVHRRSNDLPIEPSRFNKIQKPADMECFKQFYFHFCHLSALLIAPILKYCLLLKKIDSDIFIHFQETAGKNLLVANPSFTAKTFSSPPLQTMHNILLWSLCLSGEQMISSTTTTPVLNTPNAQHLESLSVFHDFEKVATPIVDRIRPLIEHYR